MIVFKINLIPNKMNSIGFRDPVKLEVSFNDAFNYPSLNRNMAMSMNTITSAQDHVKTNTQRFVSDRRFSNNLMVHDIEGKF